MKVNEGAAMAGAELNGQKVVINASWGINPATTNPAEFSMNNGPGANAGAVNEWEEFTRLWLDILKASEYVRNGNVLMSKSADNGAKLVDAEGNVLQQVGIDITPAMNRLQSDPDYGPILRDNVIFYGALNNDGTLRRHSNHGPGVIYAVPNIACGLCTSFIAPLGQGSMYEAWRTAPDLDSGDITQAVRTEADTNANGFPVLDVQGTIDAVAPTILSVSPASSFSSSGDESGPFSPSSKTYTLTNTGGSTINFSVSKNISWISLSQTSGSLAPGASTSVLVAINSNATQLNAGAHSGTVTFTNTTNNNGTTSRAVSLTVDPNTLNWTVNIQASAGGFTDGCSVNVALPASGGSQSFSCGPAAVTVTTVGVSTFQVNGSGFGSDIGGSCGGNGSGSATIFTTSTGFSASGSLNGTVVCSFGGGSTENFPLTGSFSATAPN